ncbi:MAG: outer membrane protein assembly factor BamD [Alphaproteobacteria bacterium]
MRLFFMRSFFLFFLFFVAACATEEKPVETVKTAEEIYADARAQIDAGKFLEAATLFEKVEEDYPHSFWASRAPIMAGYSYYKEMQYDDAVLSLKKFIELNPADPETAYAYYITALSYFEQIEEVGRDQFFTVQAVTALEYLINLYPNSKYAQDAQMKLDLAVNYLAGHEMSVGRYYLKRNHYSAAIGRFQEVVKSYETSIHVPEALHRLTEAYVSLGILEEAQASAAVLGHNYPRSSWYEEAYELLKEHGVLSQKKKDDGAKITENPIIGNG